MSDNGNEILHLNYIHSSLFLVGRRSRLVATTICLVAVSPTPPGHLHPVPNVVPRIHSRSNIQQREGILFVNISTVVIINNVSNILTASIDDPVVAIERKLVTVIIETSIM